MAKKKEANFTDLLVKIKRVFAKDIYILFGRWVAGGELSDANNAGVFLLSTKNYYGEFFRSRKDLWTLFTFRIFHGSKQPPRWKSIPNSPSIH